MIFYISSKTCLFIYLKVKELILSIKYLSACRIRHPTSFNAKISWAEKYLSILRRNNSWKKDGCEYVYLLNILFCRLWCIKHRGSLLPPGMQLQPLSEWRIMQAHMVWLLLRVSSRMWRWKLWIKYETFFLLIATYDEIFAICFSTLNSL